MVRNPNIHSICRKVRQRRRQKGSRQQGRKNREGASRKRKGKGKMKAMMLARLHALSKKKPTGESALWSGRMVRLVGWPAWAARRGCCNSCHAPKARRTVRDSPSFCGACSFHCPGNSDCCARRLLCCVAPVTKIPSKKEARRRMDSFLRCAARKKFMIWKLAPFRACAQGAQQLDIHDHGFWKSGSNKNSPLLSNFGSVF